MLLEFDSDQRLWRETVRDFVGKRCPAALIREIADKDGDPIPLWRSYIEQGWTELTGSAAAVELAIVLEELGRATDPTPYLATMSQFAPLAPDYARPDVSGTGVFEGVNAALDAEGWVLSGTAGYVLDGDRAEQFAVVTGAGVFVVPASDVRSRRRVIFDPVLHVAEVNFDGVRVGHDRCTGVDAARAREFALTGLAVTMVGACQRVLDMVLEHVRNRHQFGKPIGSMQAVKHKAADMHVAIERARALAYFAALTIAEDDPRRTLAASMAKAAAGECQDLVCRNGIQLFGAMGFTWENDLQFALKRAQAAELLLGGAAEHRALIVEECRATQL
ncbi:MAG: acyl-CoA dehydrogenase family protein [Nocardia sp.]|nr:acyl-CoA dehydrogenase family protein [Nocardia sp.]